MPSKEDLSGKIFATFQRCVLKHVSLLLQAEQRFNEHFLKTGLREKSLKLPGTVLSQLSFERINIREREIENMCQRTGISLIN